MVIGNVIIVGIYYWLWFGDYFVGFDYCFFFGYYFGVIEWDFYIERQVNIVECVVIMGWVGIVEVVIYIMGVVVQFQVVVEDWFGYCVDVGVDGQVGVLVFVWQYFLVNCVDSGDYVGCEVGMVIEGIGEVGGQVVLIKILEVGLVWIYFVEIVFCFLLDVVGQLMIVEGVVVQIFVVELLIFVYIYVGGEVIYVLVSVQCFFIMVFCQGWLKSQFGGECQS